jgi:hypothetical protein
LGVVILGWTVSVTGFEICLAGGGGGGGGGGGREAEVNGLSENHQESCKFPELGLLSW